MQPGPPRIIPIYTSRGDVGAYLIFPYLFNVQGEWVGWVTQEREVYSVLGYYVGKLSNDPRILRHESDDDKPKRTPPPRPDKIKAPPTVPLPPMMSDLPLGMTDVLQESPHRLHTIDHGELMEDMD
jgi:hypothetical protein